MSVDTVRYLDAQVGVLGSVLISPELAGLVVSQTKAADYDGPYRAVYSAIASAFADGRPADPIIVLDKLGSEYRQLLLEMMDLTPTAANIEAYIPVLREQAQLRRLQPLAEAMLGVRSMDDARSLIEQANALLCDRPKLAGMSFAEGLLDFWERHNGEKTYIKWGYEQLDDRLYVEKGDLVVLGGYPSAGKTALALNFGFKQSITDRVGFFSLETNKGKLFDRLVASIAKVDMAKIKRNKLEEADYDAVATAGDRYKAANVFFYSGVMSVQDIQARAISDRLSVVYIDYLQLIVPRGGRTRVDEVSGISMDLHRMAQANDILVVALSQLSRPEKSGEASKAPTMSSLRESGQIEQDADVIMLLYKTDPDDPASPRELKIAKNKEGITGKLLLEFDGQTQTFRPGSSYRPKAKAAVPEQPPKQYQFHDLTMQEKADLPF